MKNKNTLILLFCLITFVSCRAQLPINTITDNIPNGAYVKDFNNVLDPYIGNYKANDQGNEITLFITKELNRPVVYTDKSFYRDALVVKYIVKNNSGQILQDTYNVNNPNIELYSNRTLNNNSIVVFYYSGTNCNIGIGYIDISKLNQNQLKWSYYPQEMDRENCPSGTDTTIYLPTTKNLIFTKQ